MFTDAEFLRDTDYHCLIDLRLLLIADHRFLLLSPAMTISILLILRLAEAFRLADTYIRIATAGGH